VADKEYTRYPMPRASVSESQTPIAQSATSHKKNPSSALKVPQEPAGLSDKEFECVTGPPARRVK
jgi:hypothetical protein